MPRRGGTQEAPPGRPARRRQCERHRTIPVGRPDDPPSLRSGSQGNPARQPCPAAGLQQRQRVAQAFGDLGRRQRSGAGGGKLERQRHPVQAAGDLPTAGRFSSTSAKPGAASAARWMNSRTASERSSSARCAAGLGQRQRRHAPCDLAVHPQPLAARGEHVQLRAGAQQPIDEPRAGVDDVLAVVEDDEHALGADVLGEGVDRIAVRARLHAEPVAVSATTNAGSETGASSTTRTPASKSFCLRATSSSARRVFPHPPGPVSVNRRVCPSSPSSSASSRSRPTKLVSCWGTRLRPPRRARAARRGSAGRAAASRGRGRPPARGAAPRAAAGTGRAPAGAGRPRRTGA